MQLDVEHRLTEVEERSKSNLRRIDKLEKFTEAINNLAISVQVMAEKQDRVADTVDKLDIKVTSLESKPGKRWDALVDKIILTIAAALVGFALAHIGISK